MFCRCSGDDGIHVAGSASPIIRFCHIKAKKTGIRCFESSNTKLERCIIESCGLQGLSVMENAKMTAWHVSVTECAEDGLVAMGNAQVLLLDSKICTNKGPGIDASDKAFVRVERSEIVDNVGGCWVWDDGKINIEKSRVSGGPSHVVLADQNGIISARSCKLCGSIHAHDSAWSEGLMERGNEFIDPPNPVDFPIEAGPFKFEPSMYTKL